MNAPASSSRQIAWPSVITVISAAILIGAEVFGAAFAGGWALAILFGLGDTDRKSTRLNSSHSSISYAVFCLKKKKHQTPGKQSNLHPALSLRSPLSARHIA